jgi:VWFA-related protein
MHNINFRRILGRKILLLFGLVSFLGVSTYTSAQQTERKAQFSVRVNTVSVDIEVLDNDGNPVLGLTQKDFLVKEDGRPMEIASFSRWTDRPVSLAIVLDTSSIKLEKLTLAKEHIFQMLHFFDRKDELSLFSFDNRDAYLEADLSTDRKLVINALDNISVPKKRPSGIVKELLGQLPPTGLGIDMALLNLRKSIHPKKALLIISNRFRGLGPETVNHVRDSGCTLLTLGFQNKAAFIITAIGDRISRNQLMHESGGRTFSAETADLSENCRAIVTALKNYYSLGYETEITPKDQKRRRIEIQIPGHKYIINARRSYIPQP